MARLKFYFFEVLFTPFKKIVVLHNNSTSLMTNIYRTINNLGCLLACVCWIRAFTANVFVLNAIIFGIWHTQHQKRSFIRYIKLLQHATVLFQFWPGIDEEWHMVYYFFIHLSLSYLFHLFLKLFTALSPLSNTLSSSLFPFALFSSHS